MLDWRSLIFHWRTGQIWPTADAASIQLINQKTVDSRYFTPITKTQIEMHMVHRFLALVIVCAVSFAAVVAWKESKTGRIPVLISKLAWFWIGLIGLQGTLGVATVLTNKAADIATSHVLVGALAC